MTLSVMKIVVICSVVIGTTGHCAALWILHRSSKKRNPKHVFLLRCLAANDLIAQIGMLIVSNFQTTYGQTFCVAFVLIRSFGLGSGCVAFVMAIERYLALTKPFFYQQSVTYRMLKASIACIWLFGAMLTYLPLFDFGLYYKEGQKCKRYREAEEVKDIIYAYMYFAFGISLCLCIAYCNTMVFRALSRTGNQKKVLVRRISRSTMNNRIGTCKQYATSEERAFAKVMAFLCIIFVVCWMPQIILIPVAQLGTKGRAYQLTSAVADTLMNVYFTIDPYIYVLQQYIEKSRLSRAFKPRRSTSTSGQCSTPAGTPTTMLLTPPSYTTITLQSGQPTPKYIFIRNSVIPHVELSV